MTYPLLNPGSFEPVIDDLDELRAHRKTRLALAYSVSSVRNGGAASATAISLLAIPSVSITSGSPATASRSTRSRSMTSC